MIHPTAIIDSEAKIGKNCEIGPYCIIGPYVKLGDNNTLFSNVVISGDTTIGDNNKFYHSAVIGTDSQDLKDKGDITKLFIGNNNSFREFCTVNKSATLDEPTSVGNNCLLMTYTHVAHNCKLGNNIVIANSSNLAGHCHIDDYVVIGGMSAISQFVHIGAHTFIGGMSGISKDVPPYIRGTGLPFRVIGINSIGLERRGFSLEAIKSVKVLFKIFYKSNLNVSQALLKCAEIDNITTEQKYFLDFIRSSNRGINR
jgi:UDP-N-acetylglucosamine acyltransferase